MQKSPKSLIIITIFLTLFILSAASFLVLKDKRIEFGKIFSLFSREKNEKQGDQKSKIKTSASLIKSILPNKSGDVNKNQKENLTENVGQRLAATALATNLDISELKNNPEIMEKTLAGIEDYLKIPEILDDEIKISNNNSKEAIMSYVSAMSTALSYGTLPMEYYEKLKEEGCTDLCEEAMRTGNFSDVNQLIEDYNASINEIKKISAPSTWKEIHKEQISILMLTVKLLEDTQKGQDSVRAGLALKKLQEIPDMVTELEEKIFNLAQAQQIFTNSQP